MKLMLFLLLTLTAAAAMALESPAREFSAELVSRDSRGESATTVGRVYAAHGKVRIETVETPQDYYLIDQDAPSALLVRPGQRVYLKARQSSALTQMFVPVDAADPCSRWRRAAQDADGGRDMADWRCERIKPSTYRIDGEQRFIDPRLGFPVKVISADGTSLRLEHIRETTQAADLFTLPPGLREFDPRELVERIKHSDVWAAPPDP